jgi:hypothetical protein
MAERLSGAQILYIVRVIKSSRIRWEDHVAD